MTEFILGRIEYTCKNCDKNIARKVFGGNNQPFKIICLNCGFEIERSLYQWDEFPYVDYPTLK